MSLAELSFAATQKKVSRGFSSSTLEALQLGYLPAKYLELVLDRLVLPREGRMHAVPPC